MAAFDISSSEPSRQWWIPEHIDSQAFRKQIWYPSAIGLEPLEYNASIYTFAYFKIHGVI